jgi:hypothetical protein
MATMANLKENEFFWRIGNYKDYLINCVNRKNNRGRDPCYFFV